MNLRRGFRRITLVLAIVAAVFGGALTGSIVLDECKNLVTTEKEARVEREAEIELEAGLNKIRLAEIEKRTSKQQKIESKVAHIENQLAEAEKRGWETAVPPLKGLLKGFKRDLAKEQAKNLGDNLAADRIKARQKQLVKEMQQLEESFWETLPLWGLVGLCILGGLGGAAVGYFGVWIIYKVVEWLVLGFCRTADADVEQKSKTDE